MRAKSKIRDAGIPYQVPVRTELPERLETVLQVIYLVFNEGYSASSGETLTRADLSGEAIRLARLLVELLPEPEAVGLLALMLLHESRRATRDHAGRRPDPARRPGPLPLERELIAEGTRAGRARRWRRGRFGPYTLQAAIAAVHAEAAAPEETDWAQIVALYDVLLQNIALAGGGVEPGGGGGDARRSGGRAGADRRDPGPAAIWPTTTWPTPPGPTSAAAWARKTRPAPPTNRPLP